MKKKLALFVAGCCASSLTFADTYIHAGKVFTGTSETLQSKMTVVVSDNKISQLVKGYQEPGANDTVINLKDSTVLPGLMDMHVHLSSEHGGPQTYLERYTLNEADYAYKAASNAKTTLHAGFTTVRNLGDGYNETVALRKAINKGLLPGPRIFTAAKSIATTGGHADPSNGMAKSIQPDVGPEQGVINGVAQARQAVRQRYKDGADVIKITATGGVLSVAKSGQNPQFMTDEVSAIVETANDYGMTVAVHAHGKEGMKRAIKAGVTSIEHGTYMDKEAIDLMKQHNTYYVPTIMAGKFVADKAKIDGYFPELVRPKAAEIGPLIQDTFATAYKAGVNIAFGTDSGVSAHGDNAQEFGYMVEAGMPAAVALQTATSKAAKMLNVDDRLGSLEAGKLADIIAVKGNPLKDIHVMSKVTFVMKDGEIVKQ